MGPLKFPSRLRLDMVDPLDYVPDHGLVEVARIALMLGKPLLLTGPSGCGKSSFAFFLARQLGLDTPLVFNAKSTSTAKDLYYQYDALRHFQAAQSSGSRERPITDYLEYNALGLAILRAVEARSVEHLLPADFHQNSTPARSVVLIDQIDLAPRDFPNDLASELERMQLRITEMGGMVVAQPNPEMAPIVIATSNSERTLPEAFLRRSVFYKVPFPAREQLRDIIQMRLPGLAAELTHRALDLYIALRDSGLARLSVAELLDWLLYLGSRAEPNEDPFTSDSLFPSISLLAKTAEEFNIAAEIIAQWLQTRP